MNNRVNPLRNTEKKGLFRILRQNRTPIKIIYIDSKNIFGGLTETTI